MKHTLLTSYNNFFLSSNNFKCPVQSTKPWMEPFEEIERCETSFHLPRSSRGWDFWEFYSHGHYCAYILLIQELSNRDIAPTIVIRLISHVINCLSVSARMIQDLVRENKNNAILTWTPNQSDLPFFSRYDKYVVRGEPAPYLPQFQELRFCKTAAVAPACWLNKLCKFMLCFLQSRFFLVVNLFSPPALMPDG